MPQYLTPARYRTMAMGVDLSAKADPEIAALLSSASAEVNRYCAAPTGHDFRGGTVEREEHLWDTGNTHRRPTGRLWPKHGAGVMPITSCDQIDIYTTKTQYIRFTTANIFMNSRLGYVEPVAAPITTALFTAVPPWLLSSPVAYIDYTYAFQGLTVTDEELYPLAGGVKFQAANQFWTDDDVTVKVDGVEVSSPTIDRVEGTITLSTAPAYGQHVTASYSHKMPYEIALATAIVTTDMLGYSNINASGLTGLSGIRVEEIELRQSARVGFAVYDLHPAAKVLLGAFNYASIG